MDGTSVVPVKAGGKIIQQADILLVQPNEDVAFNWREALLDFGMTKVRVAASRAETLEAVSVAAPSCIVMALPALEEAFALMEALSRGGGDQIRDVPVLLVAEQPSRAAELMATHAGFEAVLTGPVSPRQIYRRAASLIQRARLSARTQKVAN
ncbi:hypothetical protein [Labrys monachus]|uniref:CheY-like chemotaxis protein n=1 Tax=Labrys monachus TaxID=217067 RepID=A0ABU0FIY1_9HYPH|nr:hypothetical protein [Labrys monachus]MDQ0394571.1 CheY-like chemotaxis protein [Labrys monachus]